MNLSFRRKKSAESNKIDKTKPSVKNFKQIYQENKNRPLTKNEKRGWAILGGIIIAILVIAHVSNVMEQSRLEKDNVPIVISDVEDNIKLDYYTDRLELSAKISGVSSFAEVKVSGDKTDIHDRKTQLVISNTKLKILKRETAISLYLLLTANATAIKRLSFTAKQKPTMISKSSKKLSSIPRR